MLATGPIRDDQLESEAPSLAIERLTCEVVFLIHGGTAAGTAIAEFPYEQCVVVIHTTVFGFTGPAQSGRHQF
jgi:hypothetical protein